MGGKKVCFELNQLESGMIEMLAERHYPGDSLGELAKQLVVRHFEELLSDGGRVSPMSHQQTVCFL